MCAHSELSAQQSMQMRVRRHIQIKMANESCISTEAVLEDKLADFWPDFPCLYDVRSSDFKNRDLPSTNLKPKSMSRTIV